MLPGRIGRAVRTVRSTQPIAVLLAPFAVSWVSCDVRDDSGTWLTVTRELAPGPALPFDGGGGAAGEVPSRSSATARRRSTCACSAKDDSAGPNGKKLRLCFSKGRACAFEVYDKGGTMIGRAPSLGEVRHNADVEWATATNVVVIWSAGSDVMIAELYSEKGTHLADAMGPSVAWSPKSELLLAYSPAGSMPNDSIVAMNLRSGRTSEVAGECLATRVEWSRAAATLRCANGKAMRIRRP